MRTVFLILILLIFTLGGCTSWEESAGYEEQRQSLAILFERGDCPGCYLRGANLRQFSLSGRNLSGADLRGVDLSGVSLVETKLSGADLRKANLTGADLTNADLRGADLRETKLEGAKLRTDLTEGAKLDGDAGVIDTSPPSASDATVSYFNKLIFFYIYV